MVSGWVHRFKYFFSPHLKGRPPLRPCHRWSDDLHAEDPTLEYLYPLFSPSLSCSFSVFCHFSCQPAKLRSYFFKWVFSGTGDSTATLLMSHWISSDTFSINRELGYSHGKSRHQQKLKTHGSRRQEMRVTSHYRIKCNTQICHCHNVIPEMALKGSVSLALMSAVLWHCGSQEVVRTILSSL